MELLIRAKQLVGWDLTGETEVLWENPSLCPQIPYDLEPDSGHHGGMPATNWWNYGMINVLY
jgi:hypothetical protein